MFHPMVTYGFAPRPQVEQVAQNMGVQTLVSPAMCGDIGFLGKNVWKSTINGKWYVNSIYISL
jgi:hypothetical protein